MSIQTEGVRAGEFLISEASGTRSRDSGVITGGKYPAGKVLGMVTASKKYTAYTPSASNGSQNAAAILYSPTDASAEDSSSAIISRDAEVSEELLTGLDAAGITKLSVKDIIIR
jgi:hypothetical protein